MKDDNKSTTLENKDIELDQSPKTTPLHSATGSMPEQPSQEPSKPEEETPNEAPAEGEEETPNEAPAEGELVGNE